MFAELVPTLSPLRFHLKNPFLTPLYCVVLTFCFLLQKKQCVKCHLDNFAGCKMLVICNSVLFTFGPQVFCCYFLFSFVALVQCSHWFVQCMIMLAPQLGCAALSCKTAPFSVIAPQRGRSQIFAFGENFETLRVSAGYRPRLRRALTVAHSLA